MTRLLSLCGPVLVVLTLACNLGPLPPPRPPAPSGPVCPTFCQILVDGQCPGHDGSPGADEVFGTADDIPCEQVCVDVLAGGTYMSNRECLDTAGNCEAAEDCIFQELP